MLFNSINNIFDLSIPLLKLGLPIGISFFTFQTMSYTIDVYRGNAKLQRNLATFATYVCLFPQLIAGPIVRYTDVQNELETRKTTLSGVSDGIIRFCAGLGKKVLIANLLGEFCSDFAASGDKSVVFYWVYAASFALQVYFDFSGYSDMAIGMGKIFGFKFLENFDYPYISQSVTEFWRRWHMTLGGWFRDYVYIPLGGNREGKGKMVRNLFVVWLLTGLWHGADWNFVIWGMGFFVLQLLEKFFLKKWLDKQRILSALYMLTIVPVSWIIFAISDIKRLGIYLSRLFPFFEVSYVSNVNPDDYIRYGKTYSLVFFMAVLFCVPMVADMVKYLLRKKAGTVATIIIFVLSMYFLSLGLDNPFLYYRF